MQTFIPTATFDGENGSAYVEGLRYTLHDDNEALKELVLKWFVEGKVRVFEVYAHPTAIVSAQGKVS